MTSLSRDSIRAIGLAFLMVLSVVALTGAVSSTVTAASTIVVDDSGGEDYTTIQAAVDNANPGDTIEIRPGTYVEQVTVTKSLTINADSGAVLKNSDSSGGFLGSSLLVVRNGSYVVLTGLTFQGPWDTSNKAGIVVTEAAHLNASDITMNKMFTDDGSGNPSGVQYHHAILVGQKRFGGDIGATPATGQLELSDSEINEFGKAAVAAASGSEVVIDNVDIAGSGVVTGPAQDTIHIDGANVTVINSHISDVIYDGAFPAGNGISVFGPSEHVEIRMNEFENVTHAITFQSRDFDPTDGTIEGATVDNNNAHHVRVGVGVNAEDNTDVLRNSAIKNNRFNDSGAGIAMATGQFDDVTISSNTFYNNTRGIQLAGDVSITENDILENGVGIFVNNVPSNGEIDAHQNNIDGNDVGLNNTDDSLTVDAERNWWGDETGPEREASNSGRTVGNGDPVEGDVDFTPWLPHAV